MNQSIPLNNKAPNENSITAGYICPKYKEGSVNVCECCNEQISSLQAKNKIR